MNKKGFFLFASLSLLSFLGVLAVYPRLPQTVPAHWNFAGEIDGYSGKGALLLLGLLPLAMSLLFQVVPKLDPRQGNYEKHQKAYLVSFGAAVVMMIGLVWCSVLVGLGVPVDISRVVPIGLGIFLLVMGNFLPQIRSNYTFGVKTSWAIENEYVWKKTQAMGGIVFCVMGVVMILAGLFKIPAFGVLILAAAVGGTGFLYLYSYLLYRKVSREEKK